MRMRTVAAVTTCATTALAPTSLAPTDITTVPAPGAALAAATSAGAVLWELCICEHY